MARLLALNPYHGGAHEAFLEGWRSRSRHEWCVLSLPARRWKWRMRHAGFTLAERARRLAGERGGGPGWDAVFCTDMVNLAEFRGLAGPEIASLPTAAYFHENQLTYPDEDAGPRDLQFAMTNVLTALAAEEVWFNSAFHREVFLGAAEAWLRRMPDHQPTEAVRAVRDRSRIEYPGIERFEPRGGNRGGERGGNREGERGGNRGGDREPGPLRLVWAARWERDKAPSTFFEALRGLAERGIEFQVSMIGPASERKLGRFEPEREWLSEVPGRLPRWGYVEDRAEYRRTLEWADAFVSTARQEFFGIAAAEAAAAGCIPVVPHRLAYPEVLGDAGLFYAPAPPAAPTNDDGDAGAGRDRETDEGRETGTGHRGVSGDAAALADQLAGLAGRIEAPAWRNPRIEAAQRTGARYAWDRRAAAMDDAIERLAAVGGPRK